MIFITVGEGSGTGRCTGRHIPQKNQGIDYRRGYSSQFWVKGRAEQAHNKVSKIE